MGRNRPLRLDGQPIDRTSREPTAAEPVGVSRAIVAAGGARPTRLSYAAATVTAAAATIAAVVHGQYVDVSVAGRTTRIAPAAVGRVFFIRQRSRQVCVRNHCVAVRGQMMLDILHRHVIRDMDGFPRISNCEYTHARMLAYTRCRAKHVAAVGLSRRAKRPITERYRHEYRTYSGRDAVYRVESG